MLPSHCLFLFLLMHTLKWRGRMFKSFRAGTENAYEVLGGILGLLRAVGPVT